MRSTNTGATSRRWVIDVSPQFQQLTGATLEWFGSVVSHQAHIFRAILSSGQYARLYFAFTLDIDILSEMHEVHLRMATQEENNDLMSRLTENQRLYTQYPFFEMGHDPNQSRVAIECREGVYFIWAHYLKITWTQDPTLGLAGEISGTGIPLWDFGRPLWKDGPPLSAL